MIIDGHCDTVHNFLMPASEYSFNKKNLKGHIDLPRLREGGVKVQVFALYVESKYNPWRSLERCLELYECFMQTAEDNQGEIELARSLEKVIKICNEGKIAALLSIEGGEVLQGRLEILRVLYRLGIRMLTLTWNHRNQLGDGVYEKVTGGGLTRFGRDVVKEMNKIGMIIDVSHLSEPGFWDVLEISEYPVIASHSNTAALCSHPRNLKDEQIKALGERGGLVGVNFCPSFVSVENPCLSVLLDHIDHIVNLTGIEHVGIGSDFDGIDKAIEGLDDVSSINNITYGLLNRGYGKRDIKKIWGENYLEFFKNTLKE
ncbi:MAG: membrane dipeptidase [Candidatus Syntrophonatronum acetioxidans]|uniref:Membrane dipeptidase n=1 Tax=Candidatus Syntrophonatronum acetioxidans TaxID=1795816 RepID=A0A424YDD3_9FIRM|nr:MAG: membrane dipeptidase [Candidatus Syntrophonatronum acetioxidans]